MEGRYFLDTDQDCHWYLIPADKKKEWIEFCSIPTDDERSWDTPEWAKPLGSGPESITFTDPQ